MWQHQGYKQKFYQVDSNISYQTERDKTESFLNFFFSSRSETFAPLLRFSLRQIFANIPKK